MLFPYPWTSKDIRASANWNSGDSDRSSRVGQRVDQCGLRVDRESGGTVGQRGPRPGGLRPMRPIRGPRTASKARPRHHVAA